MVLLGMSQALNGTCQDVFILKLLFDVGFCAIHFGWQP